MGRADILHLLGTAQPEGTGIARIVGALARGLDPGKYRVHAWFLGPDGPLVAQTAAAGAAALSVPWSAGARDPLGALRFWRALRKRDFAVVHQHFGARAVRHVVRSACDAPIVVHVHGGVAGPRDKRADRIQLTSADWVIAASKAVAAGLGGVPATVVYAGVDVRPGKTTPVDSKPRNTLVIGTACRLVPGKGVAELIEATQRLARDCPELRLEIAGDGPERETLSNLAHQLGVSGIVQFLGWESDMESVFGRWDIFAMPSLDEGFGLAALEAMAQGLPVVATMVGGLPEIVEDGLTGYLVPPSDADSLCRHLRLLIEDRELRPAMGRAGQARAARYFSSDRMVAGIGAIYAALLLRRDRQQ